MAKNHEMQYVFGYIYTVATALMARIGKHELDFSEPYIFNCPPKIREDLYLTKILEEDGTLAFEGATEDGTTYTISQSNIEDKYLVEIRDWFMDTETYQYIDDYFCGK